MKEENKLNAITNFNEICLEILKLENKWKKTESMKNTMKKCCPLEYSKLERLRKDREYWLTVIMK